MKDTPIPPKFQTMLLTQFFSRLTMHAQQHVAQFYSHANPQSSVMSPYSHMPSLCSLAWASTSLSSFR